MLTEKLKHNRKLYDASMDPLFQYPEISLGPWTSFGLMHDPKHLSFVLARYKFCAKMLAGKELVVEVGSGDGFGLPIVAQAVKRVICIDWDGRNLEGCARRLHHLKNVSYVLADLNTEFLDLGADGVYWIDVLEHLEPEAEARFMTHLTGLMKQSSVLITGTPNITSEAYASEKSRDLHVNLYSQERLKELTLRYFLHEFSFGMNDEVLHTGYGPMSHYLWSLGVQKRGL